MSAQFAPSVGYSEEYLRDQALRNARLGLLLWRIANGLVFVFFAFANFLMRGVQPSWPPPGVERLEMGLPLVITALLMISGVFATRAHNAIKKDDVLGLRTNVLITMGLGAAFLVGIIGVSVRIPYSGPYSSIILSMNAFHALHVVIGMLLLTFVWLRAHRGRYSRERHWAVEASVVFWHFVDLMWLFFFAIIYLI